MQIDTRPEDVGLSSPRLSRIGGWMRRWVDSGRLPGLLVAVVRDDRLAWIEACGRRDVEAGLPVVPDTVYRMYSMTKPITTVAALMLYEEGCFQLDDPIASYIPAFSETRVFAGGNADGFDTEPLERPITVHDLMTHTSGLTYAFQDEHPVDALYRRHGIEFNANLGPLADLVEATAAQPLAFQPGTRWSYGVSTDVLGRLVEIWSGLSLDAFLAERIFTPLGMTDTGFHVPEGKRGRFASNYTRPEGGGLALVDAASESRFLEPAATLSGGGGLVSTAADYLRFTRMLRGRGTLGGTRVLGRKTVEHMTANQLPRRSRRHGPAAILRDPVHRRRVRARGIGNARSGQGPDRRLSRRVRVGRRGEHRVLGRSRRGPDRAAPHPALTLVDLPDPARASGPDLPGAPLRPSAALRPSIRRLRRVASSCADLPRFLARRARPHGYTRPRPAL